MDRESVHVALTLIAPTLEMHFAILHLQDPANVTQGFTLTLVTLLFRMQVPQAWTLNA